MTLSATTNVPFLLDVIANGVVSFHAYYHADEETARAFQLFHGEQLSAMFLSLTAQIPDLTVSVTDMDGSHPDVETWCRTDLNRRADTVVTYRAGERWL